LKVLILCWVEKLLHEKKIVEGQERKRERTFLSLVACLDESAQLLVGCASLR